MEYELLFVDCERPARVVAEDERFFDEVAVTPLGQRRMTCKQLLRMDQGNFHEFGKSEDPHR